MYNKRVILIIPFPPKCPRTLWMSPNSVYIQHYIECVTDRILEVYVPFKTESCQQTKEPVYSENKSVNILFHQIQTSVSKILNVGSVAEITFLKNV